ncbi:MAG: Mpo1-like protein [Marinomonas sp.]|uniref:Mpo1 family 2-hydroxy fatty acid dioxygenase n=1 Tax=Marinomonas sp. TaxID=1904862 RepID=UPI003C74778B
MKTMLEHLSQYAFYHQDKRNVATHFIGIPMIVVGITALLARPHFSLFDLDLTPAILIAIASGVFYIKLDLVIGIMMSLLLALSVWIANALAAQSTQTWLIAAIGLFVVGWVFQFIGHYFEGKKPAFVDDITGLIIGPLFVFVECLFVLGLKREWEEKIDIFCRKKNRENALSVTH